MNVDPLQSRVLWFVLGNVFSVVTTFLSKAVWSWYTRPILTLSHSRETDDVTVIGVRNTGKTGADGCTGRLLLDVETSAVLPAGPDRNRIVEQIGEEELISELCWYGRPMTENKNINVEATAYLCLWRETEEGIELPSSDGFDTPTAVLSGISETYNGSIPGELVVTSENTDPVRRKVAIDVGDVGTDLVFPHES